MRALISFVCVKEEEEEGIQFQILASFAEVLYEWLPMKDAECLLGGEKEIYEAASAHFYNEAAFSISHPSFDALTLRVGCGARFHL